MGRWRGKNGRRQNYSRTNKSNRRDDDGLGESSNNDSSYKWRHWTTRRDLMRYLLEYREGCVAFYEAIRKEQMRLLQEDDENPSATSAVPTGSKKAYGDLKPAEKDREEPKEYVIGGVVFPSLVAEVFCQRYLSLPVELVGKQRLLVHECCVEADLFHDSYGAGMDRTVAISCYADGFATIEGLERHRAPSSAGQIAVHAYKPWYCRRENGAVDVQEDNADGDAPVRSNSTKSRRARAEEKAMQAIFKLIDQPGDCLRDDRDMLVHDRLHRASLADMEPPSSNDFSSWMLVDTAAKMKQCIRELEAAQPSEIAFDVESYNVSKCTQLTCLLQVASDAGREYVIDTLAPGVWNEVHGLAPLFANPAIVKVGHSIGGLDVRSLHRDFGCFLVNVFDTYEASMILGLESHGLASVCAYYGLRDCATYAKLKNAYQKCDWRVRPLTEPMIRYARYDVHYLIRLRWLMMRDLVRSEFWGGPTAAAADRKAVLAGSLIRTLVQFDLADEDGGTVLGENGAGSLTADCRKRDVFDFLSLQVKNTGRTDDDATFKTAMQRARSDDDIFYTPSSSVINDSFLEDGDDDDDEDETERCAVDITAAMLRLQPLLMSCLSLSQERCRDIWTTHAEPHLNNDLFVSLVKRSKRREVSWTSSCTELYNELYQWRNRVAEEVECLPGFVAPLDFLVCVAWKRPTTASGMRRITNRLPALLEESEKHRSRILDLVLQKTLEDGEGVATGTVYLYSSLNLPDEDDKIKKRDLGLSSFDDFSYGDFALKLFVAGTIGFGVVAAILDARRQVRK